MRPAWSVIFLTVIIGAGQGLLLAAFAVDLVRADAARNFVVASCALSLLLLASYFGLGRPERPWRAAAQWRTSWLAREVLILPALMGSVLVYGAMHFLEEGRPWVIAAGIAAAILCIALFVCTGMIYSGSRPAPLNFLLLGPASGLTLSVPVAAIAMPQFAGVLALAAFSLGMIAYLARCATLARDPRLRTARWIFLVLAFPVPGMLLGWGGGSLLVCVAAFAFQFAGLLAERWCFFADGRQRDRLGTE